MSKFRPKKVGGGAGESSWITSVQLPFPTSRKSQMEPFTLTFPHPIQSPVEATQLPKSGIGPAVVGFTTDRFRTHPVVDLSYTSSGRFSETGLCAVGFPTTIRDALTSTHRPNWKEPIAAAGVIRSSSVNCACDLASGASANAPRILMLTLMVRVWVPLCRMVLASVALPRSRESLPRVHCRPAIAVPTHDLGTCAAHVPPLPRILGCWVTDAEHHSTRCMRSCPISGTTPGAYIEPMRQRGSALSADGRAHAR